ncbi:hypothetical protein E2C01_070025 [Portunus trituberculatus]|uniref:Uncharacterized protein n=1 Tax=Portunus trituberculatus TaxID=210409 RepID=A0A5B7HW87_PORTR|nr:hypothetical protein [Portunus trituberculatus]
MMGNDGEFTWDGYDDGFSHSNVPQSLVVFLVFVAVGDSSSYPNVPQSLVVFLMFVVVGMVVPLIQMFRRVP